ncbi:MAG: Na+/H+ antiporter subunit E [Desertimonas sp.]
MNALGYVIGLAAVWVMLWGSASPGNILGGVLAGVVLVVVLPGLRTPRPMPTFRPAAWLRLAGTVLLDTARSNVVLTRTIVAGRRRVESSMVEVPMPDASDELLTLTSSLLALVPGTLPIEVRGEPRRLVVHVLHLGPLDDNIASIEHLVQRCLDAFGEHPGDGIDGTATPVGEDA